MLSLKILIAEDDVMIKRMVSRLLTVFGHKVIAAGNGQEAFERWQAEQPDMILMDIQMPVWDGMKAASAIRQQEAGTAQHVPIVALTACESAAEHCAFLAAGMDEVLVKPFSSALLKSEIERVWSRFIPAGTAGHVEFDEARALSNVDGDASILREALEHYAQNYKTIMASLTGAVASQAWKDARWQLHNLRGDSVTGLTNGLIARLDTFHAAVRQENAAEAQRLLSGVLEALTILARQVKDILARPA